MMIDSQYRKTLVFALLTSAALVSAGCNRTSPDTASTRTDRIAANVPDRTTSSTPPATAQPSTTDQTTADAAANASAPSSMTAKAENAVDDAAITTKVKTAVLAEPGLKSLQINVDTKDGVVTLTGTVDTQTLRDRATQVAQNVNGVKSVVDNLSVKSTG